MASGHRLQFPRLLSGIPGYFALNPAGLIGCASPDPLGRAEMRNALLLDEFRGGLPEMVAVGDGQEIGIGEERTDHGPDRRLVEERHRMALGAAADDAVFG